MRQTRVISYILVFIQFSSLGFILLTADIFPESPILLIIEIYGIILGLWAIFVMKPGKFNITPIVKSDSKLIRKGPYKFIRHPMYTAILLVVVPLIIHTPAPWRIGTGVVLFINMIIKLNLEERLLGKKFKGYQTYKAKTYRIIPYIY